MTEPKPHHPPAGHTGHAVHRPEGASAPRRRRKLRQTVISVSRTIHIYLTMLGLLVMALFGITGFTIDHEDWFGATVPRVANTEGTVPAEVLSTHDGLRIVEYLRSTYLVTGSVTSYDDLDDDYWISFKSPGEIWEAHIVKDGGGLELHHELFNFAAIINNLHRGRYTGPAWRWIIDISAILITVACLTGFILWSVLPRRRRIGVAMLLLGTLATFAVIYFLVPGADIGLKSPDLPAASTPAP